MSDEHNPETQMGNRDSNEIPDDVADEDIDDGHDLGAAPASWRGHIPRAFPHGPRLLNLGIATIGFCYAAFIGALVVMPTQALGEAGPLQTYSRVSQERILVKSAGDESTRDVMRWMFFGRRTALSPCLAAGKATQLQATFDAGRIRIDPVRFPCFANAMAPLRVPTALAAAHTITLTKVLLHPVAVGPKAAAR